MDDDKRVREVVGPQLQKMMQSGKVREAGILSGTRGGFFLVDVNSPEELFELFGPEIYANFKMEVHPVTPLDKIGEIFQRWAAEGRQFPLKASGPGSYEAPVLSLALSHPSTQRVRVLRRSSAFGT